MHIKRKLIAPLIFISLSFYTTQSFSENRQQTIHKFIGYEMGYGTFSFQEKLDHKLVFPVANLTLGAAHKRFSYILNVSGSLANADVSEEEQEGSASRKDYDFTFGYQINKSISVFTGYKQGETSVNLINRDPLMLTGGGRENYKQTGPYIGVNINKAIKDAGKFSVTVSYAALYSENLFIADGDGPDTGEPPEFDDVNDKTTGTTSGYSYSLNWTMPMKGNLIFRTRLRVNEYKQDIPYYDDIYGYGNINFKDINESSTMLLVGITSIF